MGNPRENRDSKHSRTTDGDIELPGVTLKKRGHSTADWCCLLVNGRVSVSQRRA